MREFIIQSFVFIPFLLNGIAIFSGIILFFWMMVQRRIWDGKHNEVTE